MSELELSKTIIAQYFANFLEENLEDFKEQDFKNESSIFYLINAIKHACNE